MKPLDEMTHAELYAMREQPGAMQGMLAPLEHRAFAREWMEENPWLASLSLPFAIPAYTAAKALGLQKARSPASMDEMMGAFHGYAEGMLNNLVPSAQATSQARPIPTPGWQVRDSHTGQIMGTYVNPKVARTKADNRNLDYGAHRYVYERIK